MGKIISVVSGKGGTGKTTTCGAVGTALAMLGKFVLCIDADTEMRNLDISLGLESFSPPDLNAALRGEVPLSDCIVKHPTIPRLSFIPAPYETDFPGGAELKRRLAEGYDFVLVDAPAGIGRGFDGAVEGADGALVVATPDASSYRDAARAVEKLREAGVAAPRLIVNRIRPSVLRRWRATVDDAVDEVGARLIGVVPEDKDVILAANLGSPLMIYSSRGAAAAYERIARRIAGEKQPVGRLRYNF